MRFNRVTFDVLLETGLHIGGNDLQMHIGGTDKEVIKQPCSEGRARWEPYVPGSSLKGRMRGLLELNHNLKKISDSEDYHKKDLPSNVKRIIEAFGVAPSSKKELGFIPMARFLFSDASLCPEWKKEQIEKGRSFYEIKKENSIDRKTVNANPRCIERVVRGAKFKGSVTVRLFEKDDENVFRDLFKEGLKLITLNGLGGSVSRGYGRVQFLNVQWDGSPLDKVGG